MEGTYRAENNLSFHPEVTRREDVIPVEAKTAETFLELLQDKLKYSYGDRRKQDWFRDADGRRLFLTFYPRPDMFTPGPRGSATLAEKIVNGPATTNIYTVYHVVDSARGLTLKKTIKAGGGVVRDHGFPRRSAETASPYQQAKQAGFDTISEQEGRELMDAIDNSEYIWQLQEALDGK